MNKLKLWAAAMLATLLGACGGGGGGSITGDQTGSTDPTGASAIVLEFGNVSLTALQSAVDDPASANAVELRATVTDTSGGVVEGATVRFNTTDVNANLSASSVTTGPGGIATAKIATSVPVNRTIPVTASLPSGATASINVAVVGTTVTIEGPDALTIGSTERYAAVVSDSANAPVPNVAVAIDVGTSGNISFASAGSSNTGADGRYLFDVTGNSASLGEIIDATSNGAANSKTVVVTGDSLQITSPAEDNLIPIGTDVSFGVLWLEGGVPKVGGTVVFASGRGNITPAAGTAVTNASGVATVSLTSDSAGVSTLTVQGVGSGLTDTITVEFVATVPATLVLTPQTTNIIAGQSTSLEARVEDPNGNAVKNASVTFRIDSDDTNGQSPNPLIAITDSNGIARSTYTAGPLASGVGSVQISANISGNPGIADFVNLTVTGQAFSFVIGTGNEIEELSTTLYGKEFSITVTDSSSNPVANEQVQVSAPPLSYTKGFWDVNAQDEWQRFPSVTCQAEDTLLGDPQFDLNGDLDPGEDFNGNGILDPGAATVVVAGIPASAPLDAGCEAANNDPVETNNIGVARVCLIYNQDQAYWVEVALTATAGVNTTESRIVEPVTLVGAASDYDDSDVSPPGEFSPYGLAFNCDDPT